MEAQRRNYTRHRDARVALIRCSECLEYYETSVRQARRIRNGENRRLCPTCRNLEAVAGTLPDRTDEFVRWWLEESGVPRPELLVLAKRLHPEEAARVAIPLPVVPDPSPSRRLPREEGNRPTPLLVAASIRLSFGSAVSTAA